MNESKETMSAPDALARLKTGNLEYLDAPTNPADVSPALRRKLSVDGQQPYAIIVTCSDSRVPPEAVFGAGLGELFVIRVAGNVIGDNQLGSIIYAHAHLGVKLVVVMGHDHCGAIDAALHDEATGYVTSITDEIKVAIGDETDERAASELNVRHGVEIVRREIVERRSPELSVIGALYHLRDGSVEWLD
jgi:carbonic anhydrase